MYFIIYLEHATKARTPGVSLPNAHEPRGTCRKLFIHSGDSRSNQDNLIDSVIDVYGGKMDRQNVE